MSMRKVWQEVTATNNEKVYAQETGDVIVKLNFEYSNAAKTIKDVL
jgi:hypothetical protein